MEIAKRKNEINRIFDIGFNIVHEEKKKHVESPITGKNIVFTGKMSGNRKEMTENAELLGAISQGGVNKNTDILVCGDKVGKNKTDAAQKFGTLIITEQEYMEMINDK